MIAVEGETLRKLQMIELEMLLEVDRICKKCGIQYTIIAGTLLGAVRNGGFIPWDDDADVAMLRPEYERFKEACRTELDQERFYFQDHQETSGYRWGYGKIRRKNTLFLREHQEEMPYEQGVFIDVFPLDQIPDSHIGRAFVNVECFFIRKFLWAKVGKIADKSQLKRRIYALLDKLPEENIKAMLNGLIQQASNRNTSWVRILMFPTPNRAYGYRKNWYERAEDICFENHIFPGVSDADAYLSFKYENYLELPPENQRKTHPVTALILTDPVLSENEIGA